MSLTAEIKPVSPEQFEEYLADLGDKPEAQILARLLRDAALPGSIIGGPDTDYHQPSFEFIAAAPPKLAIATMKLNIRLNTRVSTTTSTLSIQETPMHSKRAIDWNTDHDHIRIEADSYDPESPNQFRFTKFNPRLIAEDHRDESGIVYPRFSDWVINQIVLPLNTAVRLAGEHNPPRDIQRYTHFGAFNLSPEGSGIAAWNLKFPNPYY